MHLPSPSFWPLVLAIGLPLIGYGVIFNLWLCVVGGLLTGGAIYAWVLEPVDDPDADGHGHDDHHDGDDPDGELATVGAAGDDTEERADGDRNGPGHRYPSRRPRSARTNTGISNNKLAMWLFLSTECLLFGALISTYLIYKAQGNGEVLPTDLFDIPFTSVSSFVLLMSSLTMVLALSAFGRNDLDRGKAWLLVTAMLGAVFMGGQAYEFTAFYEEGLGYTTNPAASAFYTLTGFHGAHVSIGIIMLMSLWVAANQGKLTGKNSETVEIVGLYWHFVDLVWIFIFTVIYLIPPE